MPKLGAKNGRSTRFPSTTKYDAHHTVLSKTYGALADLRRELSDSKERVAEREELLRSFSTCADSQRAWLLLRIISRNSPSHAKISPTRSGGRG